MNHVNTDTPAETTPMPTQHAIPWEFTGSSAAAGTWTWNTPHFQVTLIAAGTPTHRHYQWALQDNSSSEPWTFAEGSHNEFAVAADMAVEYALKSYPHHGYARYAPHLATTYTIRGGRRMNISPLAGQEVAIEVATHAGPATYRGTLILGGHDVVLRTDLGEWAIRPETINSIDLSIARQAPTTGHPTALPSQL